MLAVVLVVALSALVISGVFLASRTVPKLGSRRAPLVSLGLGLLTGFGIASAASIGIPIIILCGALLAGVATRARGRDLWISLGLFTAGTVAVSLALIATV